MDDLHKLDLPQRVLKALRAGGIDTIAVLRDRFNQRSLGAVPGIGAKGVTQIGNALTRFDKSLAEAPNGIGGAPVIEATPADPTLGGEQKHESKVEGSHANAPRKHPEGIYWFAGIVALLLTVGLVIWAFSSDFLRPHQYFLLIWLLPISSGIMCGAFLGGIVVRSTGSWKLLLGLSVSAGGGFAVWLISFFVLPMNLPSAYMAPKDAEALTKKVKEQFGDQIQLSYLVLQRS
jgi:hypothetical protein